ncbi:hypothetical protein EIN_379760 [Entamoeba invadens IP1]|uniref:Uncharacterized protein n=1 Tax=Entamoeba invadens IP1 TaxID=370355 RepID=A0A0A1UG01_ENTIV|nr:hypothetical protein EIN_379760 [Entamoeba invadens IP1]ELP92089.1 hypothetical protein EIN_379760 [Entamoeba invadens IP1]|eukprot:XP_004258860.1 hypothetical protein EIN_379760 [Entamoeba invadens IP1]
MEDPQLANNKGRWIILTEKCIKYLRQVIVAYCKEYCASGQSKSGIDIALFRLNYVIYLFSIVESSMKVPPPIEVKENDEKDGLSFKRFDKIIDSFSRALNYLQSSDKKKVVKAADFFKKIDTDVFTYIPKKKSEMKEKEKPIRVTNSYIKELFNFRELLKAQLELTYHRDISKDEAGVNYNNLLIEGYCITFPFKNKRLVSADVISELFFSLFDCQTDEQYKAYPSDPSEISQTLMNLIFFWYQNYNEDFRSVFCENIVKWMNRYSVLVFDLECINTAAATKKMEMQSNKEKQKKVQAKKIRLAYINENIVADILTEIDAEMLFNVPFSSYLVDTEQLNKTTSAFERGKMDFDVRIAKYTAFVKKMIGVDVNEAYQFFTTLCNSLVYRCHNYFAAFTIYSQLQKNLDEQSETGPKFKLSSLEKNVLDQYNNLKKSFPECANPGNSSNYEVVKKLGGAFIAHPELMRTIGTDLMKKALTVSMKYEFDVNSVNGLNAFAVVFEESQIHYMQEPKTRAESLRPVLGYDLLQYLDVLPVTPEDEQKLTAYDKPTKTATKRCKRAEIIRLRKEVAKQNAEKLLAKTPKIK